MPQGSKQSKKHHANQNPGRQTVQYRSSPKKRKRQQPPPKPRKVQKKGANHKTTRHHSNHRGLMVVVFLALTIYLLGYILAFAYRSSVPVETVAYGNIDEPEAYKGIVVRQEFVQKSSRAGKPTYYYSENERVKSGAVICTLRTEETAELIEDKIEKLDKDILKKQKSRSDLSLFQEDIARIEGTITSTLNSYTGPFMYGDVSQLYTLKDQINGAMSQRNEIWLAENADSLSQLSQEKSKYEEQLAKSTSSLTAKESGILSFTYDELEETVTPEALDTITKKQTTMKTNVNVLSKTGAVGADEPLYKLITSNEWYVVTYLPLEVVSEWEENDKVTLEISVDNGVELVNASVRSIIREEKEAKVDFTITKNILNFISARNIDFRIKTESLEGIKIPNRAIVEKTLLKLPSECIVENAGETGVLKVSGGKAAVFTRLNLTKATDSEGFAYVTQNMGVLQVGDTVLVGNDSDAKEYKITDTQTYKGVFVANSSVAKFTMIDVIGQNSDYSIVRPGTSSYELQAYDTIVSDAKNIEEGQPLY